MGSFAPSASVQSPPGYINSVIGTAPFGPTSATYLKLLSDITNGERFNIRRAIPRTQWAAIAGFTSTYDVAADVASVLTDMNTAKRGDLYFPEGLFNFTALCELPDCMKISGPGRRGFGAGATGRGAVLTAKFAGPIFQRVRGALSPTDILIQHLAILGDQGTYGAGDGLKFILCAGVDLRYLVLDNFGTHNARLGSNAGEYNMHVYDTYSARAGNANVFVAAQYCKLSRVLTDGAQYGCYVGPGGDHLSINDACHFEGSTQTGIHLLGGYARVTDTFVRTTVNNAKGIYVGSSGNTITDNEIFGDDGVAGIVCPFGIDLPAGALENRVSDNFVRRYATAGRFAGEYSKITDNEFSGSGVGAELVTGSYVSTFADNTCTGPVALKHTSGTRVWRIRDNDLSDGAGVKQTMTLTAGIPLFEGQTTAPRVSCTNTAAQAVASATYTALSFDTEQFDTDTLHDTSTNKTRLTARIGGKYRVQFSVQFASSATGTRTGRVRKNGATLVWALPTVTGVGGGNDTVIQGSFEVDLAATEYIELEAFQDSGGSINVQSGVGTSFQMAFVGDA